MAAPWPVALTCPSSEERPSVLDMGEAVIARLQEKSGAPKDRILKVGRFQQFLNFRQNACFVTPY
jgi:hypothetical protein